MVLSRVPDIGSDERELECPNGCGFYLPAGYELERARWRQDRVRARWGLFDRFLLLEVISCVGGRVYLDMSWDLVVVVVACVLGAFLWLQWLVDLYVEVF